MAGKIFINYRREESGHVAGRLHDWLALTFGRDNLFMDVDNIPVGRDFEDYLKSQVASCDAMLAVIGPNWLTAKDEAGQRRLDNPDDFIAIEIGAALARNIPVVPVLVDGARVPKASELPDSLKLLARRQAVQVRHTNFNSDAEALVKRLREALGYDPPGRRWRVRATTAIAAMAVLLLAGWGVYKFIQGTKIDTGGAKKTAVEAAGKAERERQARAAEAEEKRKADDVEQQRLAAAVKAEQERQARATLEAEAKRKAEQAERQRLVATLPTAGYPSKPVSMIIPFQGGFMHTLGRILAPQMSEILGNQVVIETVTGLEGASGSKQAADAAPDGYQFVYGNVRTHAVHQGLFKAPAYNAMTDFTPVALVSETPIVLFTSPSLGTENLKEFFAYAKEKQSTMQYGSIGVGSVGHLACAMLNYRLNIKTKHVPKGLAPAFQDLQNNRIDYMCESVAQAKGVSGRAKPIAIFSKERSKLLPSVPTLREQGLSNLELSNWNAIFLPKGSPPEIVAKLHSAAVQAMKTPAVRERFETMGAEIVSEDRSTPGYLDQFLKREVSRWTEMIMTSGVAVQ